MPLALASLQFGRLGRQIGNPLGLFADEDRLYLYGDPAYGLSYGILSAYKARPRQPLNPILKAFNAIMSGHRISVEHAFGKTMMLWSFNGFKNDLKVGLSPVAAYFMVAVLFTNIHTCLHGSQTSKQFNCPPPSLETYLALPAAEH
jgi:hypothetical protein